MKVLSAVYASRERGMECVFLSKSLRKNQAKYEEKMLRLIISPDDEDGYALYRLDEYVILGKITRVEESRFDSRPTNVYHFYFLTGEQYKQLRKAFCKGKEIVFISHPESDTKYAEEIRLTDRTENDERMSQWDDYRMEMLFYNLLAMLYNTKKVRVCNNCDLGNKELFYYLNTMFPLDTYAKTTYLVGCQSYYGEATGFENEKFVACKTFLMNEEAALLSYMCYDPNDLFLRYGEISHYYKWNLEKRKSLFTNSLLCVLKGQAPGAGRYDGMISDLEDELDLTGGKRLSDRRRRKNLKKAIKALEILAEE